MYDSFYGFRERPFTLLPDPDFLFLDKKHQAALDMLETAVADRSGFCVISGEIGAGKTTLIRELLNRLDETVCVGLVSNTHPSFGELLQWIMAAYGLPCDDADALELHKRFIEFAVQQYAQNRRTLLIIDEAQNLSVQALEELRLLSSVNSEQDAILQVILVGQHQLRDRLLQPELAEFAQRITLNYHLEELDQEETCRYIQHRVTHAGGEPELFSADACQAVYRLSGGVPRLINRLCDLSLVYGCTAESRVITAELVNKVGEEQRISALKDIPRVERGTAAAEEAQQPLPDSATQAGATDPSVSATGEPADRTGIAPEPAVNAGKSTADTIVGEVVPVSTAEPQATAGHEKTASATGTPSESELHQLVVNAEQRKKRARGERGALWLLLLIVAMAGGTGWLIGDYQGGEQPGGAAGVNEQVALPEAREAQPSSVADNMEATENAAGDDAEKEGIALEKATEAKKLEQQRAAKLQREAEETARLKKESERLATEQRLAEQRKADQKRKAEETARLKKESERLATEQRLAKQREADLKREAEETARLKKESDRLERKRIAAEQRLAKQRANREAAARKAKQESRKLAKAKAAARKLAEERSRAKTEQTAAPAEKSSGQTTGEPGRAVAGFGIDVPSAYDEDDGDDIVQEARARLAGDSTEESVVAGKPDAGGTGAPDSPPVTREQESVEFAANPCRGPTARFLSTCR